MTQFVQQDCEKCTRLVFIIGDLVFDLHESWKCGDLGEHSEHVIASPEMSLKGETSEFFIENKEDDISLNEDAEFISQTVLVPSLDDSPRKARRPQKAINYKDSDDDEQGNSDMRSQQRTKRRRKITEVSSETEFNQSSSEHNDSMESPTKLVPTNESESGDSEKEVPSEPKKRKRKGRQSDKTIPCQLCDELFRTQRSLGIHEKAVHGKLPSTECDICGKKFSSVGNLTTHKHTHSDTRRYLQLVNSIKLLFQLRSRIQFVLSFE